MIDGRTPARGEVPVVHHLSRASWLALAVVAACAVAVRFSGIDHLPGINGDEPQYAVHARAWLDGAPLASLRTNNDLPMNPVFFGTVVLLQASFSSSLWTLRLAAVIQSLLAITLAFALFRRRGTMFAVTFALFVAVVPVHLGYARFAWDPAAIPTVVVAALAFATGLRLGPTIAVFCLALWVHPTTAFVLPVVGAPFVVAAWPRDTGGAPRLPTAAALGLAIAAIVAAAAGVVLLVTFDLLPGVVSGALRADFLSRVWERATQPAELASFALAYVELLSGPTMYEYVPAALSGTAARVHVLVALGLLVPLGVAGVRRQYRTGRSVDLGVAAGLALAIAIEYLVVGRTALSPSTERYGLCLIVPGCYVVASWIDALATTRVRAGAFRLGVATVGAALLVSFWINYLDALRMPARGRENTFRTGPVDPKRQAVAEIMQMRDPDRQALVYVEDWWIYWTLRYLAPPETGVRVTIFGWQWNQSFPDDFVLPPYDPERMDLFAVAWADRSFDRRLAAQSREQVDVGGYEPGPILRVHRLSGGTEAAAETSVAGPRLTTTRGP